MKNLSYFLSFLILFSCTTYQPIQKLKPRAEDYSKENPFSKEDFQKLEEGDNIKVTLISEKEIQTKFVGFERDTLKTELFIDPATQRKTNNPIPYNIHISNIESVEKGRFPWLAFGIGTVVILPLIAIIAGDELSFSDDRICC